MAKFVDTTWAACLARQNPVSTRANPACMKITRTAPMTTHSMLVDAVSDWRPSLTLLTVGAASAANAVPDMARTKVAARPRVVASFFRLIDVPPLGPVRRTDAAWMGPFRVQERHRRGSPEGRCLTCG